MIGRRQWCMVVTLYFVCAHAPESAPAGSYAEAVDRWERHERPGFLAKHFESPRDAAPAGPALSSATDADIAELLTRYKDKRSFRLDKVAESVTPSLTGTEAHRIQGLARAGEIDSLLQHHLDLPVLLNAVYARSPVVRSVSEAWRAALSRYRQAAYLDGILRQYNAFTKTLDLRLGMMQGQRATAAAGFPFPGVNSLKSDLIHTDILVAEQEFAIAVRDVIADSQKAFHDWIYIHKAIAITEENQNLLQQVLEVASRKYEAGRASYNDVIKARIALSTLSDTLVTLNERKLTILVRLNTLLDRAPDSELGEPAGEFVSTTVSDLEELYATARRGRQELVRARLAERRVGLTIALAEKMNRPDPTLGASYFEDRGSLLVGADTDRNPFRATPRQPLRSWFGQREAFIEEMRGRAREKAERVESFENQVLLEVKTAHFALDKARRATELYGKTLVPEARQSLALAEREYEAGRIDFMEYLDAQRTWLDFNLSLVQSERDMGMARAELERTVGSSRPIGVNE